MGRGSSLALAFAAALGLGCGGDAKPGDPDAIPSDVGADPTEDGPIRGDAPADVALGPLVEPPAYDDYDPHPEPPAILRDVAMIDDDVAFVHPYVPGHRTTMDGRVAIRVQGGPPGTERINTHLSFFLMVPEGLDEPVMPGAPGATILHETEPFDVLFPPAVADGTTLLGHSAICDPTPEFPVDGERPNPYACGANDCYDITVVSTTAENIGAQIWGTPVTVEVEAPKTAAARIVDVRLGDSVAGFEIPLTTEWTEPAVTLDGRLLTGRWGRAPREWTNPNTGETLLRSWDLAYSVLPDGIEPCDVTGWTEFHPLSHAPYDPQMVGRYGLAAYPLRDSEGNPIPDGEDLGGTYPWVDREGANVFMAAVPGRLVEQSEEKFPRRCVHEGCEAFEENTDWDRGFLVGGLWTRGKFVLLDAMINNQDWAVGVNPSTHYWVDLYQEDGAAVPVRFGAGRFIDALRNAGGPYPPGYTHNANILDSVQNLLNHTPNAEPVLPRDVVWLMSTGVATDEVVFDDFLEAEAFIVSNMQASVTQLYNEQGESLAVPIHWTGQHRELLLPLSVPQFWQLEADVDEEVHIQNGATSLAWDVPPYGHVDAGAGRAEPVALGGVFGRGFWLSGDNAIRYPISAQERDVDATDWFVSIFVDPRSASDEERVLATFPDGSAVLLTGSSRVRLTLDGMLVHETELPPSDGWFHLGLTVESGGRVTLLHNGLALDRVDVPVPMFAMVEGELIVGAPGGDWEGVRGWIDDFKVFAYVPTTEVMCNHAGGTLMQVVANADWASRAALHPQWAHDDALAEAGLAGGAQVECWTDYTRDYGAHLRNLPSGTTALRDAILFPEGPLRAGAPRPDSSANQFCLSCHTEDGQGGLGVDALELRPDLLLEDDPRRQPLQPPRRVFGNIPANWIAPGDGPGSPSEAFVAPPEGVVVDHWLLDNAD